LVGLLKLRVLKLARCVQLTGNLLPLSGLPCMEQMDLECCVRLEGSLALLRNLKKQKWLNVSDTMFGGIDEFQVYERTP